MLSKRGDGETVSKKLFEDAIDFQSSKSSENTKLLATSVVRKQQNPFLSVPNQQRQQQAIRGGQTCCIPCPCRPEDDGSVHVVDLTTELTAEPPVNPQKAEATSPASISKASRRNKRRCTNGYEWVSTEHCRREVPEGSGPFPIMTLSTTENHQGWSAVEISLLHALVDLYSENGHWERIAEEMPGRTAYACALRWSRLKAEEGRQKRARKPTSVQGTILSPINTLTTPSESIMRLNPDGSRKGGEGQATRRQAIKSGRWSTAEDNSLIGGVTAYLATHGLGLLPPAHLPSEDSLSGDEQPTQDSSTASELTGASNPYEHQCQDIRQSSCDVTDSFESIVNTLYGTFDGDFVNRALVVPGLSSLAFPPFQPDSALPTTPGQSSAHCPTVSLLYNDIMPWLSACHATTSGLDIMNGLALWRSSLHPNTSLHPQPNNITATDLVGQTPGLFQEQQVCPVTTPVSLDTAGSLDLVASKVGWIVGDIGAGLPFQRQEHNQPQDYCWDSLDQRHPENNNQCGPALEDLQILFPLLNPEPNRHFQQQQHTDLKSTAQASATLLSIAEAVPLDPYCLPSSPPFTCSPPEASCMAGTLSAPLDMLFMVPPTISSPTTSTDAPELSHSIPFSGLHKITIQYNDSHCSVNEFPAATSSTATPVNTIATPATTLCPMSFGSSSPLATPRVFKSREVYNLAVSRAMSHCPWSLITARSIPGRTGVQAQARWSEALDPQVKKGPWTPQEDALLLKGVLESSKCWIWIADSIPGRTQRQCRTRWVQISTKAERQAAAA